jgi:hypothetical protein
MRRPGPGTLAWLGALGPPFAWAAQHIGGYALGLSDCPDGAVGAGFHVPVNAWTIVIGGAAALVVVACGVAAFVAYWTTREADDSDAPPAGRIHFLSVIGLTITPLFLAIIVLSSVGAIVATDCQQS